MEVLNTGTVRWVFAEGNKPSLKARNLMERIVARHPNQRFVIRWMRCHSNCAHGRAFPHLPSTARDMLLRLGQRPGTWTPYIRFYFSDSEQQNAIVLLHEAAHHLAGCSTGHGAQFYRALLTVARAEGLYRPVLEFHGRVAKKVAREMRAKKALTSANKSGTFVQTAAAGGRHGN